MKFKANSTQVSIVLDDKEYVVKNKIIEADVKYKNILKVHGFDEVSDEEEAALNRIVEDRKTLRINKK